MKKVNFKKLKKKYHWANNSQLQEIMWGLEKGLDVSVYAKPEYNWLQMHEIREGLEKGIDVLQYANPEYDWDKMEEIRLKLINNKT